MPLNRDNLRTFHTGLYGTLLESVVLYKRGDDQRQGTVTTYRLWDVRWSKTYKSGEPLQGDMSSSHRRQLHIPRVELDRIGVEYINAIDTFKDEQGRFWRPESYQTIVIKLAECHLCVDCLRCDPPRSGG